MRVLGLLQSSTTQSSHLQARQQLLYFQVVRQRSLLKCIYYYNCNIYFMDFNFAFNTHLKMHILFRLSSYSNWVLYIPHHEIRYLFRSLCRESRALIDNPLFDNVVNMSPFTVHLQSKANLFVANTL